MLASVVASIANTWHSSPAITNLLSGAGAAVDDGGLWRSQGLTLLHTVLLVTAVSGTGSWGMRGGAHSSILLVPPRRLWFELVATTS